MYEVATRATHFGSDGLHFEPLVVPTSYGTVSREFDLVGVALPQQARTVAVQQPVVW